MEGVKDPILSAYRKNLLKQQECALCDSWCGGNPGKMIASVKRLGRSQGALYKRQNAHLVSAAITLPQLSIHLVLACSPVFLASPTILQVPKNLLLGSGSTVSH